MDEDKKKLWKKAIKWPLYSVAILPVLITGAYLLNQYEDCLLYTSPSPRDAHESRMPSSA